MLCKQLPPCLKISSLINTFGALAAVRPTAAAWRVAPVYGGLCRRAVGGLQQGDLLSRRTALPAPSPAAVEAFIGRPGAAAFSRGGVFVVQFAQRALLCAGAIVRPQPSPPPKAPSPPWDPPSNSLCL